MALGVIAHTVCYGAMRSSSSSSKPDPMDEIPVSSWWVWAGSRLSLSSWGLIWRGCAV